MHSPTPDAIRAAREAAGLTTTAAARMVHTTYRQWHQWEHGYRQMPRPTWDAFRLRAGLASVAQLALEYGD